MKHKGIKQVVSMSLAVVMLLSLMPATTLTAFAEEPETINSVSLSGLSMPVVGEHISSVSGSALSESQYGKYEYAVLDNQYADWRDEEGRLIEYGLQVFEAGRTYSISFNIKPKDGYAFTDSSIPVYMSNLYDHQYISNITLSQETSVATVTFTFELAGERTYADISEFRFYNVTAPSDGDQAHYYNGVWAYNNSEMTDRYWADSEGNRLDSSTVFEGGYSYSYNYEFTAFDGYKFADNVSIRNDTVAVDWGYSFNADNTKIYITIPYYIESSAVIHSVTVEDMFLPTQGGSTRDFDSNVWQHAPSGANYTVPNQTNGWYEVAAEYSADTQYEVSEEAFIAGKQYKTFLVLHANDGYKFASPENVSLAFPGISESNYSYTVTTGGSESTIIVAVTFTAQFPAGTGTINNPVVCNNYQELKYALEHPTVQGILVNSFDHGSYQGFYTLKKDKDFEAGHCAITIPANATKYLTINADINIRVPYMDYLLYSFIDNRGSLTVGGTGTLNVSMNARGYPSAIIYNNGELDIGGSVTFDPTNHSFDSVHGYSVFTTNGHAVINSGTFFGFDASAVSYSGGRLDIYGGTFRVKNGDDQAFGLNTDSYLTMEEHNVNLYGGTFDGIRADQSVGADIVKLPNLLGHGGYYTYYADGTDFDPNGKKDTHETLTVKMNNIITDVNLTIDPPKQNGKPDQTVACGDYAYKHATGNENMWDDVDVYWEESTDGKTWKKMAINATFTVGYYYRASINVLARRGNLFAIDAQVEPNVLAIVNGYYATVIRYPEEDPGELICVTYDFGLLNDNIIEQIDIDGVIEPVAGEHPSYNCAISGTGYTVNTAYDNGTYAINGMGWYDVTYDMWMKPDMTFQIGHEYKVFVDVKTENGYEFYTTVVGNSYRPAGWGYINDHYATLGIQSDARFEQSLSRTFTCKKQDISTITIDGLDAPQGDEIPDGEVTTAHPNLYTVEYINWYDSEDNMLYGEDAFRAGERYKVEIKIVPVKSEGVNVAQFVSPVKVSINGQEVTERLNWDAVYAKSDVVYVYYTFTEPASGSAIGGNVSGVVTAGGNEEDDVTIRLIPQGSEEAEYEIVRAGNSVEYSFFAVKPGTYTLKVMKNGHETYETELVVSSVGVIHDVTLTEIIPAYTLGDLDGNGKVNNRDLGLMQKHLNGSAVDIIAAAADMDGNGKINNRDLGLLQKQLNN